MSYVHYDTKTTRRISGGTLVLSGHECLPPPLSDAAITQLFEGSGVKRKSVRFVCDCGGRWRFFLDTKEWTFSGPVF